MHLSCIAICIHYNSRSRKRNNEFCWLKEHGAFALTDDGVGVQSAGMMFEAMKEAANWICQLLLIVKIIRLIKGVRP